MTYKELLDDLGSMINQVDSSAEFVSSFVSEDEAKRWLNHYYQEVYKWYAVANRDRFASTAYANTVEDQAIYTFGGDATDLLAIAWVGVKYTSEDDDYTRAERRNKSDVYDTGSEVWHKIKPIYFERQIFNEDSDHYELGIEFPGNCVPEEAVTEGLKVMYIEKPPLMAGDLDVPEKLPEELHKHIVTGASVKCFKKMGEYDKAEMIDGLFTKTVMSFMIQEQSLTSERTKRIRISKSDYNKFYRYTR